MNTNRPIVLIPTFNNAKIIANVIADVKQAISDIIVINDGSTDATSEILRKTKNIHIIEFKKNRGKGAALQEGFALAKKTDFTHAICFDPDGQCLTNDVGLFLKKIDEEPSTLWVGDRIIPSVNSGDKLRSLQLAKQFGAFWFRLYTGVYIKDTKCGFRAYPLDQINSLECTSARFEYELEILISAAWNEILVKSIPIHFLHPPKKGVPHFRSVNDFYRISKLNLKAVFIRIFLPKHIRKSKGLSLKEKLKAFLIHELKSNTAPHYASASLAFGVFMGITPLHGVQVLLVFAMGFLVKMNRPLALLGVSISTAPLLPLWIAAGLGVGKLCVPDSWALPLLEILNVFLSHSFFAKLHMTIHNLAAGFIQWFLGSFILAIFCGIITYIITYIICKKVIRT